MNKFLIGLAAVLMAVSCKPSGNSGGSTDLADENDSISYAYGAYYVVGPQALKDLGVDLKTDVFHQAYVDTWDEKGAMSQSQAMAHLQAFSNELRSRGQEGFTTSPPSIDMDTFAYAFAVFEAQQFKDLDMRLNTDALKSGIMDSYSPDGPKLDSTTMAALNNSFLQKRRMRQKQIWEERGTKNKAEGMAFLEDNKSKPGIKVTESGLQYKILKPGTGSKPSETNIVTVHYEGTFLNGEIFDSSIKRGEPTQFPVNGVIKGWTEALQMMKKGAKWQLFIPGDIAYGARGNPQANIAPNKTLVFDVELIDIKEQ